MTALVKNRRNAGSYAYAVWGLIMPSYTVNTLVHNLGGSCSTPPLYCRGARSRPLFDGAERTGIIRHEFDGR